MYFLRFHGKGEVAFMMLAEPDPNGEIMTFKPSVKDGSVRVTTSQMFFRQCLSRARSDGNLDMSDLVALRMDIFAHERGSTTCYSATVLGVRKDVKLDLLQRFKRSTAKPKHGPSPKALPFGLAWPKKAIDGGMSAHEIPGDAKETLAPGASTKKAKDPDDSDGDVASSGGSISDDSHADGDTSSDYEDRCAVTFH